MLDSESEPVFEGFLAKEIVLAEERKFTNEKRLFVQDWTEFTEILWQEMDQPTIYDLEVNHQITSILLLNLNSGRYWK